MEDVHGWNAHTENPINITGKVYPWNLYGHPSSFVCALRHICVASVTVLSYGFPYVVRDVHGAWE